MAAGLWATAAALGGFALIRLAGLALAPGSATGTIFIALALEVTGFAVSVLALRRMPPSR